MELKYYIFKNTLLFIAIYLFLYYFSYYIETENYKYLIYIPIILITSGLIHYLVRKNLFKNIKTFL